MWRNWRRFIKGEKDDLKRGGELTLGEWEGLLSLHARRYLCSPLIQSPQTAAEEEGTPGDPRP